MERSKIAIIIPAYNEAKTIGKVIKKVKYFGFPIVVNDCSTDGTAKILKKLKVKVLNNKKNLGYEKTLKRGLNFAKKKNFKFLITIDGDDQHNSSDIKKIINKLNKNDVVYTIRNNLNRFSEKFFAFISLYLCEIEDPLSGLKGYKINIFKKYNFKNWDNLFGSDLLLYAKLKGFKVEGIFTRIKKRKGVSRIGDSSYLNLKILLSIVYLFKNYLIYKKNKK